VKEVAATSGLSIRALHHYDAIGLPVPTARSAAGYRPYTEEDLLRLQQIVIGRELGPSPEAIRRALDDPQFDRRQALLAQRAELLRRAVRAGEMVRAIDAALDGIDHPATENEEANVDLRKIFNGFDPAQHANEAQQPWGDTESRTGCRCGRTKAHTEADWRAIKAEQASI
jgi:DNA-binding transcriptional MerR regulator